jgi:23S rRNA (guanosine2251-2'-O)-methyltransferase
MRQHRASYSKARSTNTTEKDGVWLFGLHAVRAAARNPARRIRRLLITPNALQRLDIDVELLPIAPEIQDPRKFAAPISSGSVHQGVAIWTYPLLWGDITEVCAPDDGSRPIVAILDQVTDPHNAGAILRTAEVFGARAVIAPRRRSAPESGALAKAASGAVERQPYIRVPNLSRAMAALQQMGYTLIGLDDAADTTFVDAVIQCEDRPMGFVFGAEGAGLRALTRETCNILAQIPSATVFNSLNVSNAVAVALSHIRLRKA